MFGLLIVLLSSVFFCFQNVLVRVLFKEHDVLGLFTTGGFVTPTLASSFLLMFMRTLLVIPLTSSAAPVLHPGIWSDLHYLRDRSNRSLLWQSLVGGGLMFLYLALLYIAIGSIPTGIAMTLFFTYPVFTALLSWKWFGSRPSSLSWIVMGFVLVGSYLTMPVINAQIDHASLVGILTGLGSGVTYAFYAVIAQKSFERIHPFSYTWISFGTTMILSGISLLVLNFHTQQLPWAALWVAGLLSAIVSFGGHLTNNFGIRYLGATAASIVAATNPALTALLAWFTIQERLNTIQIVGILIVTLSVALLSRELKAGKQG
ncbi:DMT family transporter [Leptolyngbya ohadii]|uniref:DMT family transporter n=1 Tax=Leptolyngbya ohadii TaxID=1962290 RepID=UPI000B59AA76|nr:DMT family transporter [Leptolyngbya ohadii]